MPKKKSAKARSKVVRHRHFHPSYNAHPAFHLSTGMLLLFLLALVISYIIFGAQNPQLFN